MNRSWLLFWLGIALFGVFVLVSILGRKAAVGPDFCRLDGFLPAHTVVIIDQSDPFSPEDIEWVSELIRREAYQLPEEGLFTVLALVSDGQEVFTEIFGRCSPGTPGLGIIENRIETERSWREGFEDDLKREVTESLTRRRAPVSPLFEAFERITRKPSFAPDIQNRKLIVVSDMIQNSDFYSHYREPVDWDFFRERKNYRSEGRYTGVGVTIHVANREGGPDEEALREFWRSYFEGVGGGRLKFVVEF